MGRASRTTEIYESNAIEGKPATLAETYDILRERRLYDADAALARYTLHEALTDEPKVKDVVGLAAARILVDQYVREPDRPLSEADLRQMHSLIMVDEASAGRYKQYLNEIHGSAHTPLPPSDVPGAMSTLVAWARETDAPLLWRAAVAHAWLTHIHPFDDGNGRIARLFANYILGFGCYPPLIVKSSSDRGRYITALGQSDTGGDIVPLARVFVRVLSRQVELMERPDFAWSLFQKDLRVREADVFQRWRQTLSFFIQEVEQHLLLSRCSIATFGDVAPSDFELLCNRDRGGNSWIARATSPRARRDLLVWVGHTTSATYRLLEQDPAYPAIFLSERDPSPRPARPYMPRVRGLPPLHDEIVVVPDEDRVLLRRGDEVRSLRLPDAAELFAGLLAQYLASIAREEGRGWTDKSVM